MAVFAIPNPKRSTIVDFPIERIKHSVLNINLINNKYKLSKANEIFNQYTYEAFEFLSLGIFADINLNSLAENKTEITVEVRRKMGSFNQAHEVTKAHEHLDKIFSCIANLTAKSSEETELLRSMKNANKGLFSKIDKRPLYKKKRYIIPLVILLLGAITNQFNDQKQTEAAASTQTSDTVEVAGIDLKTIIKNNIKSINGGDDFTKNEMTSAASFQIIAALYKAYALTINQGKQSTDKEVLKLTDELQKRVMASQQKNFPKLRKAYQEFVYDKLWENNIDVEVSGSRNIVLKFTSVFFADNKNIKESQEKLTEMLILLRFKQTQYRWHKEQDEFTIYTIESPKDGEIVE